MTKSALIGKAGEMLVAAHLMRQGAYVAHPAYDGGIDLLAYHEPVPQRVVPIQVKARAGSCYHFQKSWFDKAPGIVLVQVWNLADDPTCYVFGSIAEVENALGAHAESPTWREKGVYNVTNPHDTHLKRMVPYRNRWQRIIDQLGISK